jgi:hypothetical protein
MILFLCYLVGAFAYYQIFCNVYVYKREYGSHDWHKDEKDKNRMWVWILSFIGLCMPLFGAVVLFLLYLVLATVGIEEGCIKYKIPENAIFKFLNKKV